MKKKLFLFFISSAIVLASIGNFFFYKHFFAEAALVPSQGYIIATVPCLCLPGAYIEVVAPIRPSACTSFSMPRPIGPQALHYIPLVGMKTSGDWDIPGGVCPILTPLGCINVPTLCTRAPTSQEGTAIPG